MRRFIAGGQHGWTRKPASTRDRITRWHGSGTGRKSDWPKKRLAEKALPPAGARPFMDGRGAAPQAGHRDGASLCPPGGAIAARDPDRQPAEIAFMNRLAVLGTAEAARP
ncbi:MAG: hypothetical protein BM562_00095 [Alphaproteobacteria bacterium MedPE-SWcel]|nr:MAG: hypothetical protein BM562_00095 [Alphaproteobacteria bacterium MedPE-SWcel]